MSHIQSIKPSTWQLSGVFK